MAHVAGQTTLRFPITKKKRMADGTMMVWGKVTDGSVDRDGQIVDPDWAAEKLTDWYHDLNGPVRNMHSGTYPPAGKGIDLDLEDDGAYVRSHIVEPTAIKLLDLGVYKDYSVGIAEAPLYGDPLAPNGRLGRKGDPDGWINEISLVDTGSNRNAHLSIVKRAERDGDMDFDQIVEGLDDLMEAALRRMIRKQMKRAAKPEPPENKEKPMAANKAKKGQIPCPMCSGDDDKRKGCTKCGGKGFMFGKGKGADAAGAPKDAAIDAVLPGPAGGLGTSRSAPPQNGVMTPAEKAAKKAAKAAVAAADKAVDDAAAAKAAADAQLAKVAIAVDDGKPDDDDDDDDDGDKKAKAAKAAAKAARKEAAAAEKAADEAAKAGATAPDGDGGKKPAFPGAAAPFGSKKPKKSKAAKATETPKAYEPIPYDLVRAHDMLCPAYAPKTIKAAYGGVTPEVIDPASIQGRLAEVSASTKATPGSVAATAAAFAAATGIVSLQPKTLADMQRAAHKAWMDANPGLPSMRPGIISPEQFRRGYLPSANDSVSHTTTVPSPDLKGSLDADQFDRGPVGGAARQSLTGGSSVAKGFYGERGLAAGAVHDWIAGTYPGCCPMAVPSGTATDSDGQMGRPAEMNVPVPTGGPSIDAKAGATLTPVRDTNRANKGAGTAPGAGSVDVDRMVRKATAKAKKSMRQEVRELRRAVKSLAAAPDPRVAPLRVQPFASQRSGSRKAAKRFAEAKEAAALIATRDSRLADEGLDTLHSLGLSPKEFARFATADA